MSPTNPQSTMLDYLNVALTLVNIVLFFSLTLWTGRIAKKVNVIAQKDLSLSAYAHAIQGLIGLKEMFAQNPAIFRTHLSPALKSAIPPSMFTGNDPDVPAFLAFAGGMWRFSYVFSVMERWKELGLSEAERDGLDAEMRLWLVNVPAFKAVYKFHTQKFKAHNPAFLEYLRKLYRKAKVYDVPDTKVAPVKSPQLQPSGQEPVYNVLDKHELKRRMGDSFPAVYLTVISIIQGVALGWLATNLVQEITTSVNGTSLVQDLAVVLPHAFLTFLAIVIVSYEYNWFVGVYRWSPKFLDTFIPFAIGIVQIIPTFFLGEPQWWWMLNAVLVLVGGFAFTNTLRNCTQDKFSNREAYRLTRVGVYKTMAIFLFLILFLTLTSIYFNQPIEIFTLQLPLRILYWHVLDVLAIVVYLAVMIVLIYKERRFVRDLHKIYGLKY